MSNGEAIDRVGIDGTSERIVELRDLAAPSLEWPISVYEINWSFQCDAAGKTFYFTLLPKSDQTGTAYVCRLNAQTLQLDAIPAAYPVGVDFDTDRGIAYFTSSGMADGKIVAIRDFDGAVDQTATMQHDFSKLELSPDRQKLLLSSDAAGVDAAITVLDMEGEIEIVQGYRGGCAAWGPNESILYLQAENSLWICKRNGEPEQLALIGTQPFPPSPKASFAQSPRLSPDKSLVAWGWRVGRGRQPLLGTMLIDLDRQQYRMLDGWWHNVQWALTPPVASQDAQQ